MPMRTPMHSPRPLAVALAAALAGLALARSTPAAPAATPEVTLQSLLEGMVDLDRLARWPAPEYRTVQFSSHDRRSTRPDAPGWYANADGFGREPIPGFAAVLREPDAKGVGEYLLADVRGPGAIARGWSAGMAGVLRVWLDDAPEPLWSGPAYEFLARRSRHLLERAGLEPDRGDAFAQEDADYFPVPFARRLRITWRGRLDQLHFYHLQVRRYRQGTPVATLDPERDIARAADRIAETARRLLEPRPEPGGSRRDLEAELDPGGSWSEEIAAEGAGGVIGELAARVEKSDGALQDALRGILLRIRFDGASRPQVEAPLGDFFGSAPGVNPFSSLPMTVDPDGTMRCRFPMPFRSKAAVSLENTTSRAAKVRLSISTRPWTWDDRSLWFRARWRVDHGLRAAGGDGAFDLPWIVARGRGLLVGATALVMNPTGVPTSAGNWWGEGDEKIFVDDEATPSTFGTGTEDYFNYSWSRPDLFAHPYCGQPLDSGPANAGYVSNHRWQIIDAIPFGQSLAFFMELWHHTPTPGLSYARIAYLYARPGLIDDHRRPAPSELVVPPLPAREPVARGAAAGAMFHHLEDLPVTCRPGELAPRPCPIASRLRVLARAAGRGDRIAIRFPARESLPHAISLVALHSPGGGVFRATLDGEPLPIRGASPDAGNLLDARTEHATRLLEVPFAETFLSRGEHVLELECVEAGEIAADYLWLRATGRKVAGAIEAETLEVTDRSEGLALEAQSWPGRTFSAGRHLWAHAEQAGAWCELRVPVPEPGRWRVLVHATRSWDYGIISFRVDGREAGEPFDAWRDRGRGVGVSAPLDLGVHDLGKSFRLRVEVTGSNPRSSEPGHYFGIDCLELRRPEK